MGVLLLLLIVVGYVWIGVVGWLRATFTSLMSFGLAACVAGPPFVAYVVGWWLGPTLAACLFIGWRTRVGQAARLLYWMLPVTWVGGAMGEVHHASVCFCRMHEAEYYFPLSLALFVGTLLVAAEARNPGRGGPSVPGARTIGTPRARTSRGEG
jgi:hypothetical protein